MLIDYGDMVVDPDWDIKIDSANIFTVIYFVKGGEVKYSNFNSKLDLKTGYCYVFPTNIPYNLSQNSECPLNCVFLHLNTGENSIKNSDFPVCFKIEYN